MFSSEELENHLEKLYGSNLFWIMGISSCYFSMDKLVLPCFPFPSTTRPPMLLQNSCSRGLAWASVPPEFHLIFFEEKISSHFVLKQLWSLMFHSNYEFYCILIHISLWFHFSLGFHLDFKFHESFNLIWFHTGLAWSHTKFK